MAKVIVEPDVVTDLDDLVVGRRYRVHVFIRPPSGGPGPVEAGRFWATFERCVEDGYLFSNEVTLYSCAIIRAVELVADPDALIPGLVEACREARMKFR